MYFFAYVHLFFKWFLGVPALLMTQCSNLFLKYVLKVPVSSSLKVFTRLDLESFVEVKTKGGEDEMETDMFKNALHLQSVKVRECMVPRTEVVDIDVNAKYEDFIALFQKTHFSRLIISEDEVDNILGYVHHQQFLNESPNIRDIVMDMPFVPEAMNVQELLVDFMKKRTTIACVVDEFGGLAGIITMEDILEEIFGEIEDEHDVDDNVDLKLNEREYLFSGRLEIDYLNEKYDDIQIPGGDYETLSGYLVMTIERIPEEGDEIDLGKYRFILTQVSDTKIETVRLIKLEE
jgi:CBS domain containing-hemolysin-like protein